MEPNKGGKQSVLRARLYSGRARKTRDDHRPELTLVEPRIERQLRFVLQFHAAMLSLAANRADLMAAFRCYP